MQTSRPVGLHSIIPPRLVLPYDYLIVGSGLFGATFAHLATRQGLRCLVIDKRPHAGGNVYQDTIEGIAVHTYGAHIFHTSDRAVWDFVCGLTPFNRFTNAPVANYHGRLFNLPCNMNTFHQLWGGPTPGEAAAEIERQKAEAVARLDGRQPANLEEQALTLVGRDIYEILIKEYTEKQWGRPCTGLPAFIIRRLPVRLVYDNNYFNDLYQGIPIEGYNALIDRLLEGSDLRLNTDFFDSPLRDWRATARRLVYTGPLDRYFDYDLGRLDWRTVTFRTRVEHTPNYQGNAVVNYTSAEVPYTRVIEHKHFTCFGADVYAHSHTVVSEEYSAEYHEGAEPYYPVNDARNDALAAAYRERAEREPDVVFGGRLAQYRYYDMAPVIAEAMHRFAALHPEGGTADV